MKITLITILVLFGYSALGDDVPKETQDLIGKLEKFSEDIRHEAEKKIRDKELQVVGILETQLLAETQSGNLKGALAIQNLIDQFSRSADDTDDSSAMTAESQPQEERHLDFLDRIWKPEKINIVTFQFFKDGTGIKTFRGERIDISWSISSDGLVEATTPVGIEKFHFDKRLRDCYLITTVGEKQSLEITDEANKAE